MSNTKPKNQENHALDTFTKNRVTVFIHVTVSTIVIMAIIAGLAYLLDQYLGTRPKILIVGLILGYPLTQFIVYKHIRKLAQKKLSKTKK